MDSKKLEIIQQIMEELQNEMEFGEDDISSRLGREPKGMHVAEIEVGGEPGLERAEEMMGKDLDGDMEMEESPEHAAMVLGEGPEDSLKKRIMKMRG